MSNESLSHHEKRETLPPLTKAEMMRILWKSFEFAQGDTDIQKKILAKVRSYYGELEEADFTEMQKRFNKITFVPKTESDPPFINDELNTPPSGRSHILAGRKSHAVAEIEDNEETLLEADIEPYLQALTSSESKEVSVQEIAESVWNSDNNYLKKGRPNRDPNGELNTLRDPYFSFGVHYILRENSTSHPAFNRLFAVIRTIPFEAYNYESLTHILRVLLKYNTTHPETPVSDEQIAQVQHLVDTWHNAV